MKFYRHIITNNNTHIVKEIDSDTEILTTDQIENICPGINIDTLTITTKNISADVIEKDFEDKNFIKEYALTKAWDFINPYYDQPAFLQIENWDRTLPEEHPIHSYINAIIAWKSAIMFEYLIVKKTAIFANMPYDLDYSFIGPPSMYFY